MTIAEVIHGAGGGIILAEANMTEANDPRGPDVNGRAMLDVLGMHCASCAGRVEKALRGVPGVVAAAVNLATGRAGVHFDSGAVDVEALVAAVARAGYEARPVARDAQQPADKVYARQEAEIAAWRRRLVVAAALLAPLVAIAHHGLWIAGSARPWAQLLLAAPLAAYVGWPYLAGAWRSLRHGTATMDTLIALGTGTAMVAGLVQLVAGVLSASSASMAHVAGAMYFADAAMILTFITLGKWLEAKARRRASQSIRRLLDLRPAVANVLRGGQYEVIPVGDVRVGETILVRPGEKVPLDAQVTKGRSAVNQAWLTGEPLPIDREPGEPILAGTINLTGSLVAQVTREIGQTALAQVIELVQRAQESKPRLARLADRVVAWFVPGVLVAAAATLVVWGVVAGDWAVAIRSTVAVLVVACPCSLGLATPTAVLVASGRGAEEGILIKDAQSLETAARLDTMVLDKTGTVTEGQPCVASLVPAPGVSEGDLLATAAAAEQLSVHPLAKAVVEEARRRNLPIRAAENLEVLPGSGVRARLHGRTILVVKANSPHVQAAEQLRQDGQTVLAVLVDDRPLGLIGLADPIVRGAAEAVEQLRRQGLRIVRGSGDPVAAAARGAGQLGMAAVIAAGLPEQKKDVVRRLQQSGRTVAMVGDGINDAAALAAADLGIAIGAGADVAIEAADVVLSATDLGAVGRTILLGRATVRTIRQNLFWAFLYNLTLLPVAAGVLLPLGGLALPPSAAAAAMAASSVSVVANSLLLRTRARAALRR